MRITDIHTHGINGYDTRTTNPEDVLKIAEIQGASGITDIVPTVYSAPVDVMRENMAAIRDAMQVQEAIIKGQELDNSKLNTQNSKLPSRILGVHLEGPFLNSTRCGVLDPFSFVKPAANTFLKLIDGFEDIVKIITIAPELDGSLKLIRRAVDMGINVSMGHSDATYAETEVGYHEGARCITHIFNAMRGINHREPGIAGFGLINKDIYVEVIADPYHLHPDMLELIFRTKNPDRIIIISDSIMETPGFRHLTDKLFDVQRSSFNVDNSGIRNPKSEIVFPPRKEQLRGGSATITESAHRLIEMGYDRKIILKCITKNPASIIFHLN